MAWEARKAFVGVASRAGHARLVAEDAASRLKSESTETTRADSCGGAGCAASRADHGYSTNISYCHVGRRVDDAGPTGERVSTHAGSTGSVRCTSLAESSTRRTGSRIDVVRRSARGTGTG